MPHTEIEVPYQERTLSDSPTIPARVREIQDRQIHGELITRRKRQAAALEAPICSPKKKAGNE